MECKIAENKECEGGRITNRDRIGETVSMRTAH